VVVVGETLLPTKVKYVKVSGLLVSSEMVQAAQRALSITVILMLRKN
jgi:hypothetical protein